MQELGASLWLVGLNRISAVEKSNRGAVLVRDLRGARLPGCRRWQFEVGFGVIE